MGSLFGSSRPPALPPPPPVPDPNGPEIEAARRKRRLAEQKRAGRASTIVTGGEGDTSTAQVKHPGLRKLLGG